MALRVNDVLRPHLAQRGLLLVDFKLEFGRQRQKLYLGDEISPDTCRLWDAGAARSGWTRTASVATWAASRRRTRKSIAGSCTASA